MKNLVALLLLLLGGCVGMPDTVRPVENFELERYLGTWYEIARLDHPFERGLTRVSAEYSLREDKDVRVVNRGYNAEQQKWKQAEGRARFVRDPRTGYLKVSFFGPFYGSYVIFELDHDNYQYAVISGPDTSYLWILARTPQMDAKLKADLVARAAARALTRTPSYSSNTNEPSPVLTADGNRTRQAAVKKLLALTGPK